MFGDAAMRISWQAETTPRSLQGVLRTLGEEFPISEGEGDGLRIRFEDNAPEGVCRVTRSGDEATITYAVPSLAVRAVGSLMAGLIGDGETREEHTSFETFGVMLDASRNKVMKVAGLRQWLRRMALLGYNMGMLYTKDTYELPGEPYFGYLRGRYTAAELKEVDAYAWSLGIEMIPCIQALGHLDYILQWPAYSKIEDTRSVLMVDEPETYALIGKMLDLWKCVYSAGGEARSRRVHVGMDETHDLGRGRFLDRHGYERGFDIFNRHLARVVEMCEERGLKPIIWSDMYFRLGNEQLAYYDVDTVIPEDVVAAIPKDVQLCYWDYYHEDKAFYLDYIEKHRALGSEPMVASGCWTWGKVWYDPYITEATAGPCIEACREASVRDLIFTLWGDDGAYCDFDSVFAGLAWCAAKAFAPLFRPTDLEARYRAVCGGDYASNLIAGEMNAVLMPKRVLWDDPLLNIYLQHEHGKDPEALEQAAEDYFSIAVRLNGRVEDRACGDLSHARLLALVLGMKVDLANRLIRAYAVKDTAGLADVLERIPVLKNTLAELAESWRAQWLTDYKAFGLEVMQIRLGGLQARLDELRDRIVEFVAGDIPTIEELNANLPHPPKGLLGRARYRSMVTPSEL